MLLRENVDPLVFPGLLSCCGINLRKNAVCEADVPETFVCGYPVRFSGKIIAARNSRMRLSPEAFPDLDPPPPVVIRVPARITTMAAAVLVKLNLFMFITGFPVLYETKSVLIG